MTPSFDHRAPTWDDLPRRIELARDISVAIERRISLRADLEVLDCGSGTGLLALALARRVRRVVAVDSSPGMCAVLARKIAAGAIANIEVRRADFARDSIPAAPFGLVVAAMTLHHVADIDGVLRRFHALLVSGGQVALADLDAEDGTFHGADVDVPHRGFERDTLARQLAAAGFGDIRVEDAARIAKDRAYSVFLATACKIGPPPAWPPARTNSMSAPISILRAPAAP